MRAVVQRVSEACVLVKGEVVARLPFEEEERLGLLVLVGIGVLDDSRAVEWMTEKLVGLRIFEDESEKMNLSLTEVGGGMLIVSQFTLFGDCRRGKRPSFSEAAAPERARVLYEELVREVAARGISVAQGCFQTDMEVGLTNAGPVTILLDSDKTF